MGYCTLILKLALAVRDDTEAKNNAATTRRTDASVVRLIRVFDARWDCPPIKTESKLILDQCA